ncbi:hypothetical protein ThidrDRAFT_4720 [Thiorhodococcus drewsii AZ1]|uniref:Uncharacterized protein n=1 Tax=Thiorhodococcus drewsii AZ1 TaxID=765913 RepID=G2E8V6_9GAMM|nr:hypothetical protein [Thiorhodococcus drewsii]EGV27467.1 hypothetical protein ThidrDRAFT_4720 [Thiorhodococcus drewsii AZ1]
MHSNKGHILDLWPAISKADVGMIRLMDSGVNWPYIEAQKGVFTWARMQMYVDNKKYIPDSKIMYTFSDVPGWANGEQRGGYAPLDMGDWKNFVTRLVDKYGDVIDYYEMWNEFDYSLFWAESSEKC